MSKNRYYYYDHETCSFVELQAKQTKRYARIAGVALLVLVLSGALTWSMDRVVETPEELALRTENEALQAQLMSAGERMAAISEELDEIAQVDQDLYRSLLQADPISDDVRQVGVGGADAYSEFSRFSVPASKLMRETAQQLDRMERQLGLQSASFRELTALAVEHERQMEEMPAILPSEGPVVSFYGMRMHPILRVRRMHYGIDVHVPTGTPVVAPAYGVIKERGKSASFGNYIKIKHPTTGYITLFAHLSKISKTIRKGSRVERGDLIGYSGNTGLSKAPHLHYEVHDTDGRALNPIYFIAPSLTPSQFKQLLADAENNTHSFD